MNFKVSGITRHTLIKCKCVLTGCPKQWALWSLLTPNFKRPLNLESHCNLKNMPAQRQREDYCTGCLEHLLTVTGELREASGECGVGIRVQYSEGCASPSVSSSPPHPPEGFRQVDLPLLPLTLDCQPQSTVWGTEGERKAQVTHNVTDVWILFYPGTDRP